MKKIIFLSYLTTVLWILISPCSAKSDKQDYTWCKKHYGELTAADNPLAARAKAVFKRVVAVADKRALRPPKLLVIPIVSDPWAASLGDGSILLNRKALERCYHHVDERTGDSRLAFVIGHELAHLANDDFWHLEAFNVIRQFGSGSKAEKEVLALLSNLPVKTAEGSKTFKEKELHADKYGLLYAAMAGYDPLAVTVSRENNFFKAWTGQTIQTAAYTDKHHPTPTQRADFLLTEMKKVKEHIVLFNTGVRLFQVGQYEYAVCFLESFLAEFPSREVYNNIGLAYYQIALKHLAKCDPDKAFRFKLATMLDTQTRASEYVRSGPDDDCQYRKDIEDKLKKAIGNFEKAKAGDPFYLPAYINLSSAYIAAEKYSTALAVFEDMEDSLPEAKNDPQVKNNLAVASYLSDRSRNRNGFDTARGDLQKITQAHPHFVDTYYNLARLWQEKGNNSIAKEFWHRFISSQPDGIYSTMAQRAVDHPQKPATTRAKLTAPPINIGNYSPDIVKLLGSEETDTLSEKYASRRLSVSKMESRLFSEGRKVILVIEDKIEMMVCPPNPNIRVSDIQSQYGKPNRIFKHVSGMQTSVYRNFAVDITDNNISRVVYFSESG